MKTPIEMMLDGVLDGVTWVSADVGECCDREEPYATHEGVLEIGGHKLRCYRLNTGAAVINADDIAEFFGDLLR